MAKRRAAVPFVPPPAVRGIIDRLEHAGHEAWCVGGAVRDALLGISHLDWDIATSARPEDVRRLFKRTIPVGIEFGTVGVLDGDGVLHEVTTFRRDVRTDGRHAEVEFGVSLDDDLARRDFTINAIAYSPTRDELRDPFKGQRDLASKVVRSVGDPAQRMRENRLRALRGMRFAARFGFLLDSATWKAILESAPHLGRLSAERVKQEIEKTLEQVESPSVAFLMWRDAGAFASLVPGLAAVTHEHVRVIDYLPRPGLPTRPARKVLRLAALMLDAGADGARNTLRALRFSNADINTVARIVDGWSALRDAMTASLMSASGPRDADIRRWIATIGRTQWTLVLRVGAAAWAAARECRTPAPTASAVHALYRRGIRIAYRDPVELADLAVDGDDLRAEGIAAGPELGKTLARLLAAVVEDPVKNQRATLIALAKDGA